MHKGAYLNMKAMLFPNQIMVQVRFCKTIWLEMALQKYIYICTHTPYMLVMMRKRTTDYLLMGEKFFFFIGILVKVLHK